MRATRLIVLLSFSAAACNSAGAPAVDYSSLLKSLDAVVVPETAKFATSAAALSTALAAIGSSTATIDASSLASAQTAWRAARLDWRHLDAVYFGPLLTLGVTDRIDATPADDGGIDGIVNGAQTIDATLIGTLGGPQKGFLGIEYLIFSASGNAAVLTSLTGTSGAPARRRALAAAMSVEVASSAQQLATAWSPSGGNYVAQVETAGTGSTVYSQQRGALDDYVGGAAYALELVVGVRLAGPLGRKTTGMPDPASDPTSGQRQRRGRHDGLARRRERALSRDGLLVDGASHELQLQHGGADRQHRLREEHHRNSGAFRDQRGERQRGGPERVHRLQDVEGQLEHRHLERARRDGRSRQRWRLAA